MASLRTTRVAAAATQPATATEDILADLSPEERRTVALFQDNGPSVVGVSTTTSVCSLLTGPLEVGDETCSQCRAWIVCVLREAAA